MSAEELQNRFRDARLIYEGTHGMTMTELAEVTGMDRRVLVAQSRNEDWKKVVKEGVTEEATEATARFAEWKALVAKVTAEVAAAEPGVELAETSPNDPLTVLLENHRKEWMAARMLAREAFNLRSQNSIEAFNRAKLAKIMAEQMEIVQKGERRAWGIEDAPAGGSVVIVRE